MSQNKHMKMQHRVNSTIKNKLFVLKPQQVLKFSFFAILCFYLKPIFIFYFKFSNEFRYIIYLLLKKQLETVFWRHSITE